MNKVKISNLIEDFDLYPRADVDSTHVRHVADAIESGAQLPTIIADAKSLRIVDGFHRRRAYRLLFGEDYEVSVELRNYKTDADLFADAMRLNANHGRNLTSYDRTICIEKAFRFDIDPAQVASCLNIRVDRVKEFRLERCAKLENSRRLVPLKMPVRHLAGTAISKEQAEAIEGLGGNSTLFLVNQLISMLKNDLIDRTNERLMERLLELKGLIA